MNKKIMLIALILAMITWGLSWPSAKVLVRYGDPQSIAFLRMIMTTIGTFFIFKSFKIPLTISKSGLLWVIASGILLGIYNVLFFNGIKKGMPGAGGILVTTMTPIMAYLFATIINKRKNTTTEKFGLLLGIVAALILLKFWDVKDALWKSGNAFFILAVVVWVMLSRVNSKSRNYGHPLAFSWWMYVVCSVVLLFFSDYDLSISLLRQNDLLFWGNMFFNSVINAGIATTIFFVATTQLGVERTSSFIYITPVAAALSSFFFLGEIISWHTALGGFFALMAVSLLNKKKKKLSL